MQLFPILFLTASLALSALAAPFANTTNVTSSPCRPSTQSFYKDTTTPSEGPSTPTPSTPTPSESAPNFLAGTQVGQGTWYGPGLGACGYDNTSSQHIVAVSWILYDNYPGYNAGNPNTNPVCGRHIQANYGENSVDVMVVDRCTGCNETDLDFSPAAFKALADPSVGRIYNMTWTWTS